MGSVYTSLLLILLLQTVWIISSSPLYHSNNNSSSLLSISNHSINSLPLQRNHQVLVSPRGGGGGGEENRTAAGWVVSRARGGRSGGVGGGTMNHRPGKANQKNAANSNLFKSKITLLPTLLLITSYFYLF